MSDTSPFLLMTVAAFRYVITVDGEPQGAFTECTLPVIEWEMEEIKEGGLNTYIHQVPGRRKTARITLKNGVGINRLFFWYIMALNEVFQRKTVTVVLLNSLLVPVMVWNLQGACPVRWTGPQLKSDTNAIAIQTLELVCNEISVY